MGTLDTFSLLHSTRNGVKLCLVINLLCSITYDDDPSHCGLAVISLILLHCTSTYRCRQVKILSDRAGMCVGVTVPIANTFYPFRLFSFCLTETELFMTVSVIYLMQ